MKLIDSVLDLIFPPRCFLCRKLLRDSERFACRQCADRLHTLSPAEQRKDIRRVALCIAPFSYEGKIRESILRYKFGGITAYGKVYSHYIAQCIKENNVSCDIITWTPLSKKRLRKRGYDQAEIIARELAVLLGLPCERLLEKCVDNPPQSSVGNAEKRRANASGVYSCVLPERVANKTVLLTDDIVTTGETVSECARVLKASGCKAVYVAAAATRNV